VKMWKWYFNVSLKTKTISWNEFIRLITGKKCGLLNPRYWTSSFRKIWGPSWKPELLKKVVTQNLWLARRRKPTAIFLINVHQFV
jgi:hypothetical protein